MPRRFKGLECKYCNRHVNECGPLSARGKCWDCGLGLTIENITGLFHHNGEPLRRWRRGMIGCAGGELPADLREME